MKRLLTVAVVIGMLIGSTTLSGAVAAPAPCKPFVPTRALRDNSGKPSEESLKAPVIKVGDRATKAHPVTRRYEIGPALFFPFYLGPDIIDGQHFFNFQVTTARPSRGLYVRIDWPAVSPTDIDIFLNDARGQRVGASDATNAVPRGVEEAIFDPIAPGRQIHGGPGFELIPGVPAARCAGFMLDVSTAWSPGEKVVLSSWLGKVRPEES